ncbi:hypothetical protein DXU04_25220 [Bradyrhizobium diazoefficiens]
MRDQLHQQVDALDEGRAAGHRARGRRRLEQAFGRLGVFREQHLVLRIGAEAAGDRVDMIVDRLRALEIAVHGVADRLRLVRRDAAVVAGQQHRPLRQRHEQGIEHFQLHRHVVAVERHRVDVGFELAQHLVVLLVGEDRCLEVGGQADVKHVRGFLRRTEGLRVGRAQRHQARLEPLPHLRVGIGLLEIHACERRNPLQIGQRRHVHDRQARQLRRGDLDHEHAHRVVGVLRLLHRKADHVVTGDVDIGRRHRIELAGQVAREDRPVHRLVAQLDADLGTVTVDQLRGLGAADQGDVVSCHQQLRAQQGAVGSPENQYVARHVSSLGNVM